MISVRNKIQVKVCSVQSETLFKSRSVVPLAMFFVLLVVFIVFVSSAHIGCDCDCASTLASSAHCTAPLWPPVMMPTGSVISSIWMKIYRFHIESPNFWQELWSLGLCLWWCGHMMWTMLLLWSANNNKQTKGNVKNKLNIVSCKSFNCNII